MTIVEESIHIPLVWIITYILVRNTEHCLREMNILELLINHQLQHTSNVFS